MLLKYCGEMLLPSNLLNSLASSVEVRPGFLAEFLSMQEISRLEIFFGAPDLGLLLLDFVSLNFLTV